MAAQPVGVNRSVSSGQLRLMTKIAHLYHEQNLRQGEIASLLHISQAKVSRLLKRAGDIGIVRTVVVVSQGVRTSLEQALEQRYGLLEAVVADVDDDDEAAVNAGIGSAGASYLEATLAGGERIGVSSWSQTLLSVADRLAPLRISAEVAVSPLSMSTAPSSPCRSWARSSIRVSPGRPESSSSPGCPPDRGERSDPRSLGDRSWTKCSAGAEAFGQGRRDFDE